MLPLTIEASPQGREDAIAWLHAERMSLDAQLLRHGALLFRGFGIADPQQFERFIVAASSEDWVDYREAATPRSHVAGHVYTSTEYPAEHRIFLHNENSHVTSWPARLHFCCVEPSTEGGQTPIADCRRILNRLRPTTRQLFAERGWMYVRTFGYQFGFPWQTVFDVTTKDELLDYCRRNFMQPDWLDSNHLKVRYRRWAIVRHPATGEELWFNHGLFYNVLNLSPELRVFADSFGADKMPYNTYWGDGSPVPLDIVEEIRQAYDAEKTMFDWQKGDVLVIDNMLVCHGREPFRGSRAVYVGMTGPIRCEEVADTSTYTFPRPDARVNH